MLYTVGFVEQLDGIEPSYELVEKLVSCIQILESHNNISAVLHAGGACIINKISLCFEWIAAGSRVDRWMEVMPTVLGEILKSKNTEINNIFIN